jgi:para-aminobenzoate synthetase component 1
VPSPAAAFTAVAGEPGTAFLDGRLASVRAPLSHLAWKPAAELRIGPDGHATGRAAAASPLDLLDEFLVAETARGRSVIGALAYELRHWIEERAGGRPRGTLPIAVLYSFERVHTFDHLAGAWTGDPPDPIHRPRKSDSVEVSPPRPGLDFSAYQRAFRRLQEWIAAGDVYQANLSVPFSAEIRGSAAAFYERLAEASPPPYGGYLDCGDFQILSVSPELLLERRGARLETRPIKGTRPRGSDPAEDRRLAAELRSDPKELAEHVMIVDLERNDLGRIAEPGSVAVEEFATVVSYATVHHLESTVRATVRSGLRFSDFLRALFPGGSITGAPKIRAMQILQELEPQERGFFTGSLLLYRPDGNFTMNICIRTATVCDGGIRYAAGGGVVADSRPEREYEECLLKARAFFSAARDARTR